MYEKLATLKKKQAEDSQGNQSAAVCFEPRFLLQVGVYLYVWGRAKIKAQLRVSPHRITRPQGSVTRFN